MIETETAAAARIYEQWHEYARTGNVAGLVALYAPDATFETPLLLAIYDGSTKGVLRGHKELEAFFVEGTRRRPNELVRWHRTGRFFTGDGQLVWEYLREAPDGEQVDIAEFMDIKDGLITHHRIYWGWFGLKMLLENFSQKRG